jgi:hypothetical protein
MGAAATTAAAAARRYAVRAREGTRLFNRASVNVSSVHYRDKPKYPVDSATALSVSAIAASPYH